jgi:hypothetical protein
MNIWDEKAHIFICKLSQSQPDNQILKYLQEYHFVNWWNENEQS